MKNALALRGTVNAPIANDCSGVTITSAAYVQLVASNTLACSAIEVFNTSAKAIKIALGAAGKEVDKYVIPPATQSIIVPLEIAKGIRISAKALGADATTGFLVINQLC